ncbi:hypothetical protein NEFER03_0543 [Nematocida sp. LUAm3]|nr:hypothetical protein NEFER03_0543 [Nematocida sp. LUAm3]KAI5175510.1 hypothetical protein NEFER02_1416 [Nematocida sp. LUAm2]KAI5178460.1 hypothetical protein NEFER01_1607 [Nematocida sp. LUAm1]
MIFGNTNITILIISSAFIILGALIIFSILNIIREINKSNTRKAKVLLLVGILCCLLIALATLILLIYFDVIKIGSILSNSGQEQASNLVAETEKQEHLIRKAREALNHEEMMAKVKSLNSPTKPHNVPIIRDIRSGMGNLN